MSTQGGKRLYTTHEVAKLLGVTPITVIRWIESGKFRCFTTVGGHRRVEHEELERFAKSYNLPWHRDDEVDARKEFVVLAVDDEPDILELLKDMLSEAPNIKFIAVTNAYAAAAKLVEERPNVILLDFLMPELDGFQFCRFIRDDPRFRELPIIAVTGLKSSKDLDEMKKAGAHDVLFKPFEQNALVQKIENYRNRQNKTNQQNAA